jgi:hypothetical protein
VRSKLQLLQGTIAGTVKGLNDAAASRTLQPADGGEEGAMALPGTSSGRDEGVEAVPYGAPPVNWADTVRP